MFIGMKGEVHFELIFASVILSQPNFRFLLMKSFFCCRRIYLLSKFSSLLVFLFLKNNELIYFAVQISNNWFIVQKFVQKNFWIQNWLIVWKWFVVQNIIYSNILASLRKRPANVIWVVFTTGNYRCQPRCQKRGN